MNRKIRVWNEKTQRMAFYTIPELLTIKENVYTEEDNFDVMHSSGQECVDGNDIYEGDIVEFEDEDGVHKGVVEFDIDDYASSFVIVFDDGDIRESFYGCLVLGNIHENKDLLDKDQFKTIVFKAIAENGPVSEPRQYFYDTPAEVIERDYTRWLRSLNKMWWEEE